MFQVIAWLRNSYQNFNIFGGLNWILLHAYIHRVKQTIVHMILSRSVHQNTYGDVIKAFCKKTSLQRTPLNNGHYCSSQGCPLFGGFTVLIVYCTLPAKYQHTKHSVRNMIFFFTGIIVYLTIYTLLRVVLSLDFIEGKGFRIFLLCLDIVLKFALLIGYILAFHFSKLCEPIRKLFSFKKPEPHQQQEAAPLQEQEVKDYESVAEKQSSVTPVTHFTIRHTGAFTSAPPTIT